MNVELLQPEEIEDCILIVVVAWSVSVEELFIVCVEIVGDIEFDYIEVSQDHRNCG